MPTDNNPAFRLLALDVDGTLLTSAHRVSPVTREAVRAASAAGIYIVLASARGPAALRPLLADLGISGYVVSFAGALVGHLTPDPTIPMTVIAEKRLSRESAHHIVRHAIAHNISLGWFTEENWFIPGWDATLQREAAIIALPPVLTPDLTSLSTTPYKLQCMVADEAHIPLLHELVHQLPADCNGQFSHPTYLEIIPADVDKATGLQVLAQQMGIALNEMAAIGDGENDLPMLRAAGLGIAMGNAPSSVKQAADWITASNDEDGVAIAIERFLLTGG